MSVKNLNEHKLKRSLLLLMSEFNVLYQKKQPSHHFNSISVFDSYQLYVSEFFIKKLVSKSHVIMTL